MPDQVQSKLPPLNHADYEAINKDLRDLQRIMSELEVAQAAEVDCADMIQGCKFLIDKNMKVKAAAFPHAP